MKQNMILCDTHNISLQLTTSQKEQINYLKTLFHAYTKKVYIVGGTLRNHFLNINYNNDIDIEVHDISIDVFEKLMNKIKANGVGKSFFVYKYKDIDISLPRLEKKVSIGHRGFEVTLAKDEYTASLRRDFTMNALMYNVYNNEILDFHNGISDIKNKLIKVVNEKSFSEDSLRVLRAIRFSCKYNLKIQDKTMLLMQNIDISDLSSSRISEELKEIFKSKHLTKAFFYMIKSMIIEKLFDIKITNLQFIKIIKSITRRKKYFNSNLYEYYYLFILKKYLKINIEKLNLSKRYKFIQNEININHNITNKELYTLALKKPINQYLDATNEVVISKAKYLNIYENKLILNIDVQQIINDGYKNKQIKIQIQKEEQKQINTIICQNAIVYK